MIARWVVCLGLLACACGPETTIASNGGGAASSSGGPGAGAASGGNGGSTAGSGGSGLSGGIGGSAGSASGSSGQGFVTAKGTHFERDGAEYAFIGVNMRGLVHYGHEALPYADAGHVELNLAAVQGMSGRVVRAFVAYHGIGTKEAGNRLEATLDAAAKHGLTLIVVFTDFYNTGFNPKGDDGFYAADSNGFTVLNHDFFASGYQQNYKPLVQALVTRFKDHPAVFAWELGNEIRDATFAGLSSGKTFVDFCLDMAGAIRAIDSNHMISVGEIGATVSGLSDSEQQTLYSDANISFLTTRSYDGGFSDDTGLAASVGKPIIVEEAGFSGSGRPKKVSADLTKWFGKGCRGYLQWGFMSSPGDNGDGDTEYGMDHVWHQGDWDGLHKTYQSFAQGL
ncbi:MAG: cellulase family glycosylhydrolase [Polyangiaceae bacterium]